MQVGDKVRMLHGKESGVVTKKLDRGLVEVEIEDGFGIPVLETELVVIAAEENTAFGEVESRQKEHKPKAEINKEKGYFLAIIPLNDKLHSIYLLNQVKNDALILVNEINNKLDERSILSEKIFSGASLKLTERNIDQLNNWAALSITILEENSSWSIPQRPEKLKLKLKAKHFKDEKNFIQKLNKSGYLIKLNSINKEKVDPKPIDASFLKEKMLESAETPEAGFQNNQAARKEVDLHIEAIRNNYETIPKNEILLIQLSEFEQKLNQGIAAGLDEMTFIHGVGNGVLKHNIHKILSQHDHIKYFKDAHKEKFGYGATLVRIN